ncbi:MAG: Ig-like domain-containing protein, partial [Mariprofundaceae bacterium]
MKRPIATVGAIMVLAGMMLPLQAIAIPLNGGVGDFVIEEIPLPSAVNDFGKVLTESGVWSNGVLTAIDVASVTNNPQSVEYVGINNSDQVIMNLVPTGSTRKQAFMWQNGIFTNLGTLGGHVSKSVDINNLGQVAGVSRRASTANAGFLWDSSVITDLGWVGWGAVKALNNSGFVLINTSSRQRGSSGRNWHVLDSNTSQSTSIPVITEDGRQYAVDINNTNNQVVGWGRVPALNSWGSAWHVLLSENGATTVLGGLGDFRIAIPTAINDDGTIVGNASYSSSRLANRAFIYTNGNFHDLNGLLPVGSGWSHLKSAFDINNNGAIIGIGIKNGVVKGFMMSPVTAGAPTVSAGPITTNEDTLATEQTIVTDPDIGDTHTYAIQSGATHGTATINTNGMITYLPDADYNGPDSFVVLVIDSAGARGTSTVNVVVVPVNDAPASALTSIVTNEDSPSSGVTPIVVDVDNTSHTFQVETQPAHGAASLVNNQLIYTPELNYLGADSFTFRATDSGGLSVVGTAGVTIFAINDAPFANDDTYATDENVVLTGASVLANDSDAEGSPLTASLVSGPGSATLVLNADGTFTYSPYNGFVGTDSFSYQASDGLLTSNVSTVYVTVSSSQPSLTQNYTIQAIPTPYSLNDSGKVLTAEGIWSNGSLTTIDLSDVTRHPQSAKPVKINNSDHVIMNLVPTGSTRKQAFMWQNGIFTNLGTLGGYMSNSVDINNLGQVAGVSRRASTANAGFLWDSGVITDLGWVGWGAVKALNDSGFVLINTSSRQRGRSGRNWHVLDSNTSQSTSIPVITEDGRQYAVDINNTNNQVVG